MIDWVYNVQLFALIIVRVTACFFQMPVLGGRYIPNMAKVGLGAGLAVVIFPLVPKAPIPSEGPLMLDFAIYILKEIMVGVSLSLIVGIYIDGVRFAGRTIGRNMGMMMANVLDPETNRNVSIVEQFNYLFFIFTFLTLNGHYFIIKAIVDSYSMIPIGGFNFHTDVIFIIFDVLVRMFEIGFVIAMPVFGCLIINTVMLGFVAKLAQKVKVMLISFPMKIGVGIFVMALCFPMLIECFMIVYDDIKVEMYKMLQAMY